MIAPLKRGQIVEINLDPVVGREQGRMRPSVVVQNNVSNRYGSTTIVLALADASHIHTPSPNLCSCCQGRWWTEEG